MLTLKDGRTELWQWDTGRELKVEGECSQVHFSNKIQGRSIDVDVVDGVAKIPDVLLQTDGTLNAWAFVGTAENGYTKVSKSFIVNKRNRPADYVFTPTDQTSVKELNDRLEKLEASQDPEAVGNAVKEYLENNPIKEEDPTVPQWAKEEEKPTYTADEVGALPKTTKIPSKTSELTNDSGYLTSVPSEYVTETELTAKGYAKQTDVDNLSKDLSGYALKEEIPIHLPNPQKLTFTGAVQGEYDGSNSLSVDIPSGSGGGGLGEFELIDTLDFSTEELGKANSARQYNVKDITQILLIWQNMSNATTSASAIEIAFLDSSNNRLGGTNCARTGKQGGAVSGYTIIELYKGVGVRVTMSTMGAISNTNYTIPTTFTVSDVYNLLPVLSMENFYIANPPTQYFANQGIVKVYVR